MASRASRETKAHTSTKTPDSYRSAIEIFRRFIPNYKRGSDDDSTSAHDTFGGVTGGIESDLKRRLRD